MPVGKVLTGATEEEADASGVFVVEGLNIGLLAGGVNCASPRVEPYWNSRVGDGLAVANLLDAIEARADEGSEDTIGCTFDV